MACTPLYFQQALQTKLQPAFCEDEEACHVPRCLCILFLLTVGINEFNRCSSCLLIWIQLYFSFGSHSLVRCKEGKLKAFVSYKYQSKWSCEQTACLSFENDVLSMTNYHGQHTEKSKELLQGKITCTQVIPPSTCIPALLV